MPVRCPGNCFYVGQRGVRIADGFNEQRPGFVVDSVFKSVFLVGIHEGCGNAVLRKSVLQQVIGAAINGFGRNNIVSCLRKVQKMYR